VATLLVGRAHALALAAVLAFSTLLECYRLAQNSWGNAYYSAAVKSMLGSLHNFFFVSSDPGGLVSVDKPPLALWVQTVSAAIFGFHPLSLLVPQAICGVLAVALLYAIVAPRFGPWPGVAAAATLAVFPAFVASARDNNLDALLIVLMVLACWTGLHAIETGQWRWLATTAGLVGLAFNTKTLAGYLVVPGLTVGWLVCAPGSPARRVRLLVGAGAVLAAVSLVWVLAVELTPASQRPYVGSTSDNSELSLSFVHNGIGRVAGERNAPGQIVHAALNRTLASANAVALRSASGSTAAGSPSVLRLFNDREGDQGEWLLAFALIGLPALALAICGRGRRDRRLAVLFVMGGWFVAEFVVLSVSSGIIHPYYVSALGPGVAAMTAAGAASFTRLARRGRRYLILPAAALATTVAVALVLLHHEHNYLHWLWPVLVCVASASIVIMVWRPSLVGAALGAALGVALVVPAVYSTTVWQVPVNGPFPAAGPYIYDNRETLGIPLDQLPTYRGLIRYVDARDPGSRWDLLTQGATTAAALSLLGARAAALGGYGTIDPVLSPAALARLVAAGEARYVALGGGYATRGGNAASAAVASACRAIAPARWRHPRNYGTPTHPRYVYPLGGWNLMLYDCAGRTRQLAAA
jgi:4-amino-4-deoxy-L-arabinose transferase-like glycosyltransferase